jgi:hypothetical protein
MRGSLQRIIGEHDGGEERHWYAKERLGGEEGGLKRKGD